MGIESQGLRGSCLHSSESIEHKKVKTLIEDKLREWTGATLQEYPSSGHRLDVFAATPDGISIYVEIIWSDSLQNFYRDMTLILTSDANVKLVVVNPKLLNGKCQREYEKIVISQRKLGFAIHNELIDAAKIIDNPNYLDTSLKDTLQELLGYVHKHGRIVGKEAELCPPEPKPADKLEEHLLSNLFPVKKLPQTIFSSSTYVRKVGQVFSILGRNVEEHPFLPKNKRLYVFYDLKKPTSIFAPIITPTDVIEEETSEWLLDDVKRIDLAYLLNLSIQKYCRRTRDLYYDKRHDRFICMLKNGQDNISRWKAGTKHVSRAMAIRVFGKEGNLLYCRHQAANLGFIFIDDKLYLKIEPSMTFTYDGYNPIRIQKLASLMSRYLSKQYNSAHLNQVRLWAKYLSRLDVTLSIPASEQRIEVGTTPAGAPTCVGIARENERLQRLKEKSVAQ